MKSETTKAIVLRRTNYGEADRIIQFCTPLGKRTVMARGVRKPKSKLAGGIELLSVSSVVLRHGKGSMATLVQARMDNFYGNILNDYDRLQFAYEMLQLVAKSSESIDEPGWFELLKSALESLHDKTSNFALTKAWFYLNYTKLMGDELSLWHNVDGKKIEAGKHYRYDIAQRGLAEAADGVLGENHIKILRLLQTQPLRVVGLVSGVQSFLAECANVAIKHAAIK